MLLEKLPKLSDLSKSQLSGKRVLVRLDLNVPIRGGEVQDDTRILASLPTLNYLLDSGAKVIACSHLGRPKGKVVPELSLEPVYCKFIELREQGKLHAKAVKFSRETIGSEAQALVQALQGSELLLLENTRFYKGEEENDPEFTRQLAELAELFVNDAFGTLHRVHASTGGVISYLPSYIGFLVAREVENLSRLLQPERPYIVIMGGAKVSDKVKVIRALLEKADKLLIGGAMAFTFLKAQGKEVGRSLVEDDYLKLAGELYSTGKIVLPVDVVVTDDPRAPKVIETVDVNSIPKDMMGVDIGPRTVEEFKRNLGGVRTIFWNGPMGIFEVEQFARGSQMVAELLVNSEAFTVVGGGDSAACIRKLGLEDKVDFVSTGGGASLKFLERGSLPVLELLANVNVKM